MLKFSTFTGTHNKEKQRGRKEIKWGKIGATQLGRCWGATDCPEGRRRTGEETSVENEKRYTELPKSQISREKE